MEEESGQEDTPDTPPARKRKRKEVDPDKVTKIRKKLVKENRGSCPGLHLPKETKPECLIIFSFASKSELAKTPPVGKRNPNGKTRSL